jgi:hypothetical protein
MAEGWLEGALGGEEEKPEVGPASYVGSILACCLSCRSVFRQA